MDREKQRIKVDLRKLSHKQKYVLIDFIKKNIHFISSKFTANFSKSDYLDVQNLWKGIAEELSKIPGATKSWSKWKKSWQSVYRFARRNVSELQQRAKKGVLTDTQKQLLNIINLVSGISDPLSLDLTANEMVENHSDDEEMFFEEEWLEDIDINDKESELHTINRLHYIVEESKPILVSKDVKTSTTDKNIPISETSNASIAKISNAQENACENTCRLEPSVNKKRKKSANSFNDDINLLNSKISCSENSQVCNRELANRECELLSRERELSSREHELAYQEKELKKRSPDPLDREFILINRERELIFCERKAIRREHELLSRESELLTLNRELLEFERKLVLRAKKVDQLENTIRNEMEKKVVVN